jgi:hypothetical protein
MKLDQHLEGAKTQVLAAGAAVIGKVAPSDVGRGVLQVVTPFISTELAEAALRHAGGCSDLEVNVMLVDIQVIPFPTQLDQPPINKEYSQHRLRKLLERSGLPGRATVLYSRDWLEGFRQVVAPHSLVLFATARRWFPTREKRLARVLTRAGYRVMLLPVR